MKIQKNKLNRQIEAIDKWRKFKGIGRGIYPTGFGKTYIAMIAMNKFHAANPTMNIVYLCNSDASRKNIYTSLNNLKEHFDDIIRDNLYIATKAEAISNTAYHYLKVGLLVVDEVHEYVSDKAYELFSKINYKFILGLTGTDLQGHEKSKLDAYCPAFDVVSYKEAIENEWISDGLEYNLCLTLPKIDKDKYDKYSEHIKQARETVNNDYDQLISMAKGRYNKITKEFVKPERFCEWFAESKGWKNNLDISIPYYANFDKIYNPSALKKMAEKFMHYVEKRNELLNSHSVKLRAVIDIINIFKGKKIIVFNNSIPFIDVATSFVNNDQLPDVTHSFEKLQLQAKNNIAKLNPIAVKVHSKLEKTAMFDEKGGFVRVKSTGKIKMFGAQAQKTAAIKRIEEGTSKIIFAVKALDTAFNIEDLEIAIISGGSTNPLQQKQRRGRVLRISEFKQLAKVINVYFKGTTDEYKLKERQKGSDLKIVRIDNINELIN